MTDRKPRERPLFLDMDPDEALERFLQTDPEEVRRLVDKTPPAEAGEGSAGGLYQAPKEEAGAQAELKEPGRQIPPGFSVAAENG